MPLTQEDLDLFLDGPDDVGLTMSRLVAWRLYRELRGVLRQKAGHRNIGGVRAVADALEQIIKGEVPAAPAAVAPEANGVAHG